MGYRAATAMELNQALLLLNGWLGRRVRLLVLIRQSAPPEEVPPSGPAMGWHALLSLVGTLDRPPPPGTDVERQLTIGTYQMGDGDLLTKLLLDDLPCDRVTGIGDEERPNRIDFYLVSTAVLSIELLGDS
jgi:hypothetical protein